MPVEFGNRGAAIAMVPDRLIRQSNNDPIADAQQRRMIGLMRVIVFQFLLVALAAVILTTLTVLYDFDNPVAFCAWFFGLPLIVAVIANKGVVTRLLASIALLLFSFVGMSVAVYLTGA
jgi:hypothetical protein